MPQAGPAARAPSCDGEAIHDRRAIADAPPTISRKTTAPLPRRLTQAGGTAHRVGPDDRDAPVSLQTIANAYGDYTRKSFEQTRSFFDKLTGVRSLDKVVEIQTEFAKQACETFVAEAQKIRDLHRELARQRLERL